MKDIRLVTAGALILSAIGCGNGPAAPAAAAGPSPAHLEFAASPAYTDVAVATADLNGDGYLDLVVLAVSGSSPSTVSVYLGPLSGPSQAAASEHYTAPAGATCLAVADMNGDGIPDLLVGGTADGSQSPPREGGVLVIFRGVGGATAQALQGLDTASVAAADVDGDGVVDLLASGSGYLYICRGLGAGTFDEASTLRLDGPWAVGDFSGNGHASLALRDRNTPSTVDVFSWDHDHGGVLRTSVSFSSPVGVLAAADLNGDGRADLVAGLSGTGGGVGAALRTGPFTFSAPVETAVPAGVGLLVIGDFNGDGIPDACVAAGPWSGTPAFYLGDGTGAFASSATPAPAGLCGAMAAGDLDGNGRTDLVAVDGGTSIYFLRD